MHKPTKHKSLSAPFVVTVAAAAALGAASLVACDLEDVGDGPCNDPATCSPTNVSACPNVQPTDGAGCSNDTLSCKYDLCSGSHYNFGATCSDGRWKVEPQGTCNPPPPACPTAAPSTGASCADTFGGFKCTYGDCYGTPTIEATCDTQLKWSVAERSCNPPPPAACPADKPVQGTTCDARLTETCGYDDCYGRPSTEASCKSGIWEVSISTCNPPPPSCPTEVPASGAACPMNGLECDLGDCYGAPTHHATCNLGKWEVTGEICNPPPPVVDGGVCPAERPAEGSPCPDSGQECTFGDCYGEPTIRATCGPSR